MLVTAPTVRDVMKDRVESFNMEQSMPEATGIIARSPVAAIPVIDENGEVVGLLTEKDCLRAVGRWAYEGISGGVVKDYMSELTVRLTPQMDLLSASLVVYRVQLRLSAGDGWRSAGRASGCVTSC